MSELLPAQAALRSFCTFRLEQRLYGIDVARVREVSPFLPITPVPQAPPAVRGLFNLRSHIYLALDLQPLLGRPPTHCTAESRFIILKPNVAPDAGVLVEQGGDIVHTSAELIEPAGHAIDPPAEGTPALIAGVCRLPAELMMVVDLSRITEIVMKLIR
jgi:purine-binding chemotaxis protein CheW